MTELTEEHQDLLQLLYMAPVGLIKADLKGDIALANAMAAQLLMPLSRDGEMANLFTLLEDLLPDFRSQVASFIPLHGSICDSMQIRVNTNSGDLSVPKILSVTVIKINEVTLVASLSDVSEEKRMAMQIAESEARMRGLLDAALDSIISMDAQGHITDWNRQAECMFGWTKDEVMGAKLVDIITPEQSRTDQEMSLVRFLKTGQTEIPSQRVELTTMRRGGFGFPAELSLIPFEMNGVHHVTAFISDITDRKRADQMVHQLAYHDPLTGLANRTLLRDRMSQAMMAGERSKFHSALMLLDLDNFKPINDLHGHNVGDLLLVEVARRLKNCVREVDTVARLGGDEFVVLLGNLDVSQAGACEQCLIVAEKIRVSLSSPYQLNLSQTANPAPTVEHHCSASIGVVMFVGHQASLTDILKRADAAMYQAKDAGRNMVRFYGVTQ
jgi:diguanylate cyclase (GGDEF)-like protein/PAS domain S-box-containing protein